MLLDARAGERYRGDVEPIDRVGGHIPGALSAPTTENVGPDGRFLPAAELAARFKALGAVDTEVGVYCGSGVSGAHEVLALAVAGIPAALYAGSWSEWSRDESRPVATGPRPAVAGGDWPAVPGGPTRRAPVGAARRPASTRKRSGDL